MKKTTLALTISALIALVLGVEIFVVEALINPGVYTFAGFFADSWGQIYLWFSFLSNSTYDLLRIVMLSAIGVFGLIIPIIWIVLMVKYNKPESALVLVSWYLILAVSVFDTAFLVGAPNFLAVVLAPTDILTSILLWATHAFIALALILILIAGIINMAYCANAPTPPKRTFSNASGADERLVLIREEPQPNAPSADEIREVLHDELENSPAPAEKPEQAQSPVHTVNTQPGISGPLLVQYINTYGPQAQPQAAPAPQQNLYPPYPFLSACPCARGNFVPCMQAGYCPCMKDGKFPCLEQHSVSEPKAESKVEPASAPVAEPASAPAPVAPATSGGYDVVKEESTKSEEVDIDKIKEIMHGELGESKPVDKPLVKEEPKASAPSVVSVGPSLEEIRAMVRQELKVEEKEEKPAPIIVAVPAPVPAKSEPVSEPLSEDKIRALIADELAKLIVKKEPEPMPKPLSQHESEDSLRAIIVDELAKVVAKPEPAPVETVKPVTSDEMRQIMAEMVDRLAMVKKEPSPAVIPEPAPAPAPAPAPVKATPPVVAPKPKPSPKNEGEDKEKPNYVRIPFRTRIQSADKEMKMNFNELKSEVMSYGVKSRISNSGDTFRLHTKTYVKITIAGKSLKLYFALDPKDYEKTTLPVQDAGHKGIYKEIPLVFKVKSELSLRRAKQLIADVMEKNGLEQGKVELHNWVKEIKD